MNVGTDPLGVKMQVGMHINAASQRCDQHSSRRAGHRPAAQEMGARL